MLTVIRAAFVLLVMALVLGSLVFVAIALDVESLLAPDDREGATKRPTPQRPLSRDAPARGRPPVDFIHLAAHAGSLTRVQALLASGTDVDERDVFGFTPLMKAADRRHLHVVNLLIRAGADVHAVNEDGWTALHHAASRSPAVVRVLIASGANVGARTDIGMTPLMAAAAHGNLESVKVLVAAGADINAESDEGVSARMIAEAVRHDDVAVFLAQAGAAEGAGFRYSTETASAIIGRLQNEYPRNSLYPPLHQAVIAGDVEAVSGFVRGGADIEELNAVGNRPLHLAVMHGHLEIARYLLERGADVSARGTMFSKTALEYARTPELVQLLERHGAK